MLAARIVVAIENPADGTNLTAFFLIFISECNTCFSGFAQSL